MRVRLLYQIHALGRDRRSLGRGRRNAAPLPFPFGSLPSP
nr:MAG TPA: hypothetical protein [Caudoviricetes sp.]